MIAKSIIISSPYHEPAKYWRDVANAESELQDGRRRAAYHGKDDKEKELELVNHIRPLVKKWRKEAMRGGGGVSRTTMELLNYWHDEGRKHKLFFAQLEAAETIIFLTEARDDYLQGINIPLDEIGESKKREGLESFSRWCCKIATGGGKTTVMAMLAAWSILNKIADHTNKKYCDSVLVISPNLTIRERLGELEPQRGENSIYRTRDLVPKNLMPDLLQGKVLTINWHVLEAQSAAKAKVVKTGRRVTITETVYYGTKTDTLHGKRYMTPEDLRYKANLNLLHIIANSEKKDKQGNVNSVQIRSEKYIETDAALVRRVLGRDFGNKQNILVMNDEAHHAYRLHEDDGQIELSGDEDIDEEYIREATVWVDGLDKIHKHRTIKRCLDFSATPYFLGKVGKKSGGGGGGTYFSMGC